MHKPLSLIFLIVYNVAVLFNSIGRGTIKLSSWLPEFRDFGVSVSVSPDSSPGPSAQQDCHPQTLLTKLAKKGILL